MSSLFACNWGSLGGLAPNLKLNFFLNVVFYLTFCPFLGHILQHCGYCCWRCFYVFGVFKCIVLNGARMNYEMLYCLCLPTNKICLMRWMLLKSLISLGCTPCASDTGTHYPWNLSLDPPYMLLFIYILFSVDYILILGVKWWEYASVWCSGNSGYEIQHVLAFYMWN